MLAYFKVPVGWTEIAKRTVKETISDDCLSLSAQLAYYFFLALFPALLFLVALASFFPLGDFQGSILTSLQRVAPPDVIGIIREQIAKISESKDGGLLTFGMLMTIWSSSAGILAIINTLNRAYDIEEGRPWWKVRITAVAMTIGVGLFVVLSFLLVVAGPGLAEKIAEWSGFGQAFVWAWKILQWPIVFTLVASGLALIYYFGPDAEQEFVWITPGSLLATLLWILFSLGFRYYIVNFTNYNETYGAIGGVIVLLLWFYTSGLAMLIGAEMNAEIEHASPYGKEPGEKVPGQRRKIGALAARAWEEARRHGKSLPATPAPTPPPAPVPVPAGRPRAGEVVFGGVLASVLGFLRGRRRTPQ